MTRNGDEGEHGAHLTVKTPDESSGKARTVSEAFVTSSERRELRDEIEESVRGKRLAVFLDYDGTLTPIVRNPEDATLSDTMREAVQELASLCKVAVVSGRDRKDVEGLVRLEELVYAGSHGFDIAGPGGLGMENEEARDHLGSLDAAEEELRERLTEVPGARVERKRYSLAIHYRNCLEDGVQTVRQNVDDVAAGQPDLRRRDGKKVFELQPGLDWDKGKAVLWLLEKLDLASSDVVPLYVGDDLTDEDAFRALAGRGLRFVVGPLERRTEADYLLRDVDDVEQLLRDLARLLSGRQR